MRRWVHFGAAMAVAVTFISCGDDDDTIDTTPAVAEAWHLVVISDSALGDGTNEGANRAVPEAFARAVRSDLGVEVEVEYFYYGGAASEQVLSAIRTKDAMRAALGEAEVIVLWVPYGELKSLCPWSSSAYRPGAGTSDEYQACGSAMADSLGADADAIMSELTSLRSPNDAVIRVLNYWVPFVPTFEEMGLLPVALANFDSFNNELATAAAAHGLELVDLHAALMGPDGEDDPVARGLVQTSDEVHLTEDGVDAVVDALRELGYEPLG